VSRWKYFFSVLIRMTLLPALVREGLQRRKVTILLYHDPNARRFAQHLAFLKNSYNLISLRRFVEAHFAGSLGALPRKSLVITFDDGHHGNYALRSLLRDLPAPATIFLCSGVIGTNRPFWFRTAVDLPLMKRVPDDVRLARLPLPGQESDVPLEPQALTHEQIAEMKQYVDFQSHTISHPILPFCAEAKAWAEISDSKLQLESTHGLSIIALSYPNGDYSAREIRLAKNAGYTAGLSVDFGFNSAKTDLFRLRRIGIDDEDDVNMLVMKSCGLWGFLKRLLVEPNYGYTEAPAADA
jgi:peptidoglycan/xylan/chitin deacetylase (PgdA/CDA1 family)